MKVVVYVYSGPFQHNCIHSHTTNSRGVIAFQKCFIFVMHSFPHFCEVGKNRKTELCKDLD